MNLENAVGLWKNLDRLSNWQKWRGENGAKILIAHEKREGWLSELPFYIFWCGKCENFSYDYPHGHLERRYLFCHCCGARIDFRPRWIEWKILFEFLKHSFKRN